MRKSAALILMHFIILSTAAQQADTARFNPLRIDIKSSQWCIGINTGIQKRFDFGLSLAKTFFLGSPHGVYGYDIYAGVNFFPDTKKASSSVTGYRFGADYFGNALFVGAELQYLKSSSLNHVLFTPKAGIGFSLLYISYGYSLGVKKFPLDGIGRNAFRLQFNLPFYTKDLLKNEAYWWSEPKKKK